MYKKDPSFRDLVKNGKGFCLPHFADLVQGAAGKLNEKDRSSLYEILFPQMTDALDRIAGDLDWFQKKFDYQFKDADWKDSKDAVQRAMDRKQPAVILQILLMCKSREAQGLSIFPFPESKFSNLGCHFL